MSTRKAQPQDNAPLSQERYMSSPEYAELRGLSGTAVAPRAAIVDDPAIRRLVWFLQARSIEPGGLKRVARELLEIFPHRIGTRSMHKFGIKVGQDYNQDQVNAVRAELPKKLAGRFLLKGEAIEYDAVGGDIYSVKDKLKRIRMELLDEDERADCERELAESQAHPTSYPAEDFLAVCRHEPESLVAFLTDICVNPRRLIVRSAEREKLRAKYEQRLEHEFPDQRLQAEFAELFWFDDIVVALLEYQQHQEAATRADFVLTTIGKMAWETLDFALKAQCMVVIEGWEGRGKSEAVKAWCRCHDGEARFVNLSGVTSKTAFFRAIAKALGIASSYSRTATEMQARIEDVLQRSRLLLVVDEAHFAFPQSQRIYSRPEIVDWIDTALCNHGVPVALITTPQFINCVQRAEKQVGWNWRQFRRRVKRWVELPKWNTEADLDAVARKILPGISKSGIKLAIAYSKMSFHGLPSRDISGLGDVATEARILAEAYGRDKVTFEDVERAINEHLLPSDSSFAARMAGARHRTPKKRLVTQDGPQSAVEPPLQEGFRQHSAPIKPQLSGRISAAEPHQDNDFDQQEAPLRRSGDLVKV